MSTIVTRSGKGSPLTHNEVDTNFSNLNTDKIQSGNTVAALTITALTTPSVQASGSGGLALKNSAGTTQISMGAGGGDNITIAAPIAITPANGLVNIAPTGTGSLTINPDTAGTMNNIAIGGTTPLAITGTTITANSGFSGSGASLTSLNGTNISSGTLAAARLPALAGDVSSSAGSNTLTLATVNSNTGSFGSTTVVPVITVNGKGLVTAVSTATVASAGKVLQVVQTVKTDTFSTTSTSFVDITGLSVSISPTSANSKILVIAYVSGQGSPAVSVTHERLMRDSTAIAVGDASGSRTSASSTLYSSVPDNVQQATITYLDNPSTTSSITYKYQIRVNAGTGYINRTSSDTNNSSMARTISTITVMEIAG